MRKIGRTREKIAEYLRSAGFELRVEDIWLQTPYFIRYYGCARWGATVRYKGFPASVHSWDRMSDIIKSGGISVSDPDGRSFEIHTKD